MFKHDNLTLEERISNLSVGTEIVKEILDNCTLNEMKYIIATKGIRLARKFNDELNKPKADALALKISMIDVVKISSHLMAQEMTKKKNVLDVSSYFTTEVKAVSVGNSHVTFIKENSEQGIDTPHGVMGGISGAMTVATVLGASIKTVVKERKDFTKLLTFHAENELAPTQTLTTYAANISGMRGTSIDDVVKFKTELDSLTPDAFQSISESLNLLAPTVKVKEEGIELKQPLLKVVTKSKVQYRKEEPSAYTIQGSYDLVAGVVNRYQMGIQYPPIKRIARNMWTGTPVDTLNVDHVIALHDAGVTPDSTVLVVSTDSNLVSLLRSNFGEKVYGLGYGPGSIPENEAQLYAYDYVYYPKPVKCNPTGAFDKSMSTAHASFIKKLAHTYAGKLICHISPLLFYCKEFAQAFGLSIKPPGKVKVPLQLKKIARSLDIKEYLPTSKKNYDDIRPKKVYLKQHPISTPVEVYRYFDNNRGPTTNVHAMTVGTYTLLGPDQVMPMQVPCTLTQLSYTGTVLYSPSIALITVPQAIGSLVGYMRDVFKSVWNLRPYSANHYTIRRVLKGAAVEDLAWEDTWSAMYSSEVGVALVADLEKSNVINEEYDKEEVPEESDYEEEDVPEQLDFEV